MRLEQYIAIPAAVAVCMSQAPGPMRAYYRKLVKQMAYAAIVD